MTPRTREDIAKYFDQPFFELLHQAHTIHRQHFDPQTIQTCNLLSIKTGACPEDCGYCAQSVHHKEVDIDRTPLMDVDKVRAAAQKAKDNGATRFCMGAAWRTPPTKTQFNKVRDLCKEVKDMGMETCMTLGMLDTSQAQALKEAGLDYYNHNLDTSPEHYDNIITTRSYQDRLDTLQAVADAGLKTCCGGIMGLGESRQDRVSFLHQLCLLPAPPSSIPINQLVPIQGTPLVNAPAIEPLEFVRTIAVTRVLFPKSFVRLAAGREHMPDTMQALCYYAGANSIFVGDKLLTTENNKPSKDMQLFQALGLKPMSQEALARV